MFDHRLGLALGKTVTEIRAMPYAEYKSWYAYYLVEPFGWWQEEVQIGRILSMLHNTHASKAKATKDFIRFEYIDEVLEQLAPKQRLENLPLEERRRIIKEAVMQTFGEASKASQKLPKPKPKRKAP